MILLIDDETIVRNTTQRILYKMGYEVITAENGIDGLEKFQEHSNEIKLVILDMVMPLMGGRECYFELKKINKEVKVIVSSGYSLVEDIQELWDNGLDYFIQKPFRVKELDKAFKTLLN